MKRYRMLAITLSLLLVPALAGAQAKKTVSGGAIAPEKKGAKMGPSKAISKHWSKDKLIANALSAAPATIARNAAVMGPDATGAMVELRAGTNGFTCFPDTPDTPGLDPMCVDANGLSWAQSWMKHDPKPGNTAPGIGYMLMGGSDISATDPWQTTTDTYVSSPPHWMLLWPVDAKTSGLATTPKKNGTWIMWAGTPYSHLMINQKP